MLISAHLSEAKHQAVEDQFPRLSPFCYWKGMQKDMEVLVEKCPVCKDYKAGRQVPRTYADTVHGTR